MGAIAVDQLLRDPDEILGLQGRRGRICVLRLPGPDRRCGVGRLRRRMLENLVDEIDIAAGPFHERDRHIDET